MTSPGGYQINPGLYRVPDLLTEEQFVRYMKSTYNRDVEFTDGEKINSARALGQVTVKAEEDLSLKYLNNLVFQAPGEVVEPVEPETTKATKK